MRYKGRRQSSNVEDRRGQSRSSGGLGVPLLLGGFKGKWLILIVVLLLISRLFGGMGDLTGSSPAAQNPAEEEELMEFVSVVLAETEDVWNEVFQKEGGQYREPGLVIYSGSTQSGCGVASSGTGPFYCPADEKVYLDLSFFEELKRNFQAPGDYAMAYVIAHEVGHHVQNLTGIMDQMEQYRRSLSEVEYNKYSVRLELQADYLAGVFTAFIQKKGILEVGDVEEAMKAASQIGDDRLQELVRGDVEPDLFTHGTSEQRMRWFMKGYESGNLRNGDTFSIPYDEL